MGGHSLKRYLVLGIVLGFGLMTPLMAYSPAPPTFRLATAVIDEWSYTLLNDAQLNSIFGPLDERIEESWGFWDNQSFHVSAQYYRPDDNLALVATDAGYYTTASMRTMPDPHDYVEEIIEVSPMRLVRRCTDYKLTVDTIAFDMVHVTFTNNDMGSSFGAFNSLVSLDEPAQEPALVFAVPFDDIWKIEFHDAHYQYADGVYCYWVCDFPIIAWDPNLETPKDGRSMSFYCFDDVNVSITLIDGWSYTDCFDMNKGFPLPENETLAFDYSNQTVTHIGEPLVSFMPEVELPYYEGWHEPDYSDYKVPPKEPDMTPFYIVASVVIGIEIISIIAVLVLIVKDRRASK